MSAEPGWLSTSAGKVFCWYHPPTHPQRNLAVLLCDPLGSDRMNLHLAYRHLALALAEAGFAVLRLDYPGTCDSEGSPRDPDRLPAILDALNDGADYLKSRSGVPALALFGARFGGTLAHEIAAERNDVPYLALWGAYASGRQFLRNESAFEAMAGANPAGLKPTHWLDGDLEAWGFLYRQQTVDAIRAINAQNKPNSAETLIFDWDDPEDCRKLVESRAPAAVTYAGLVNKGSESLQSQQVPWTLIQQTIEWLKSRSAPQQGSADPPASSPPLERELDLALDSGARITERAVHFGKAGDLFGILTTPDSDRDATAKPAILLVNGGNNHRVGINRNYTEWARHWAGMGHPVLRMDIRGLGDSPPAKLGNLNRLYMESTVGDVLEAATWLRTERGFHSLVLCGYCAGAYQALNLARQNKQFEAIMLIELLRYYHWEPLQNARNPWRARLLRYWARYHPKWLIDRGRIGSWLRDLCNTGVRTLVVYREDERMLQRFESEISSSLSDLQRSGNFELAKLSPSNHIISPLFAQEELAKVLSEFLDRSFAGSRPAS